MARIKHVKHKIARSVGILYKIRHYPNKQTLLNMFTDLCPYLFNFMVLKYGVMSH